MNLAKGWISRTMIGIAGTILIGWGAAGCNSSDVSNLSQDTRKLGQDIAPTIGNAALATKISTHLSLHKGIDMSGLHIETSGKTATVSGHVRDKNMHHIVITVVKETTGVDSVVDQLREEK